MWQATNVLQVPSEDRKQCYNADWPQHCPAGQRSWRQASGVGRSLHSSSSGSSLHQQQLAARRPRLGMLRPCAAAGSAASGDSAPQKPSTPQQQPLQQPRRPPRELSLIQRWRALKFAAKEAAQRLR